MASFFFGCKEIDKTTKEEGSREEDRQEGAEVKKQNKKLCFLVFRCTGEYISLELFYDVRGDDLGQGILLTVLHCITGRAGSNKALAPDDN